MTATHFVTFEISREKGDFQKTTINHLGPSNILGAVGQNLNLPAIAVQKSSRKQNNFKVSKCKLKTQKYQWKFFSHSDDVFFPYSNSLNVLISAEVSHISTDLQRCLEKTWNDYWIQIGNTALKSQIAYGKVSLGKSIWHYFLLS